MKKPFFVLLALVTGACSARVQTTNANVALPPSAVATPTRTQPIAADTANLQAYAGTYAVQNLPFTEMVFSVQDGQIWVKAGQEQGALTPLQTADTFDAAGRAVIHFQRDATKKVTGLILDAGGTTFAGQRK